MILIDIFENIYFKSDFFSQDYHGKSIELNKLIKNKHFKEGCVWKRCNKLTEMRLFMQDNSLN